MDVEHVGFIMNHRGLLVFDEYYLTYTDSRYMYITIAVKAEVD